MKRQDKPELRARIIPRDEHNISRRYISDAALKVIAVLRKSGFQAYLVGGSVRDLLLGQHPKDFDVATDARPEQVKQLFRSARIIGRRFKIVHVRYGREVIEVTTFRGGHDEDSDNNAQQAACANSGMLIRDNVFGTLEEDALRRDLTINALYYTTADFAVYDYTGGLEDLRRRIIRIIGDAATRYREDPVRMLRVARFAAKLGFTIAEDSAKPIPQLADNLQHIAPARLFDESLKLFMSGYGEACFEQLEALQLFSSLFPETAHCIETGDQYRALIKQALRNTDSRIQQDKPVTPAFIYAALLWPAVDRRRRQLIAEGQPELAATQQAGQEATVRQLSHTALPKRFSVPMREIWEMQPRLKKRTTRNAQQLIENSRFRAAYDFLLLREQSGEATEALGAWWTDYQSANPSEREQMSLAQPSSTRRRRRPAPRKRPVP